MTKNLEAKIEEGLIDFHLDKTSHVVTCDAGLRLEDFEKRLNKEGFTGAYWNFKSSKKTLAKLLEDRESNIYFIRYNGLEELCVGGRFRSPLSSEPFDIKVAPRAATGSDLRRVLIGSKGLMGGFSKVTLKVYPLPEKISWFLIEFDKEQEAVQAFKQIYLLWIRPLYVSFLRQSPIKLKKPLLKNKVYLALRLSSLEEIVQSEQKTLQRLFKDKNIQAVSEKNTINSLDQALMNQKSFDEFTSYLGEFFQYNNHPEAIQAESDLRKFLEG